MNELVSKVKFLDLSALKVEKTLASGSAMAYIIARI